MHQLRPFPTSVKPTSPATTTAKALAEAQAEVETLITTLLLEEPQPAPARVGSSAIVYLIISSQQALLKKYGAEGFQRIDAALHTLQQAITNALRFDTLRLYVDMPATLAPYGLQPVDATNPWQIKLLIEQLATSLRAHGQELRYLLIVGDDRVIPFHRLPNPMQDQDHDVPSDNPYASQDANYFIPERAVGRLPDGEGEPVTTLLHLITAASEAHRNSRKAAKGLLATLRQTLQLGERREEEALGLGYSASIWRKASRHVLQPIGANQPLRISPPLTYQEFRRQAYTPCAYFNLHGIADGPEWYGQRDPLFPAAYDIFPVALRPEDLRAEDYAGAVVFTEACYGAHILGKHSGSALALKFLALQARAVVGSTNISYGSITPPLIGADLLGQYFWKGILSHLSLGEALKYAKVNLAREMQERQGYLDAEDQKTLLSFVLYGDPALSGLPDGTMQLAGKTLCPPLIYQRPAKGQKGQLSEQLVTAVKQHVEAYLPHLAQARIHAAPLLVSHEEAPPPRAKRGVPGQTTAKWALTLEKDFPANGHSTHHQIVTVTVDEHGAILKTAMSR